MKKNISNVIIYYLTKFHCLAAFTSCDIGQYVYCNCSLIRLWRHKFEINPIFLEFLFWRISANDCFYRSVLHDLAPNFFSSFTLSSWPWYIIQAINSGVRFPQFGRFYFGLFSGNNKNLPFDIFTLQENQLYIYWVTNSLERDEYYTQIESFFYVTKSGWIA